MKFMIKLIRNSALVFAFVFAFVLFNSKQTNAASFSVAAGYDEAATNGSCALTEALANIDDQAQTYPDCPAGTGGGNDIINLPEGTITLVQGMNEVGVPFSVQGQGKDKSFIDGAGMNFVFKFNETGPTSTDYELNFEGFSISNIDNGFCIFADNFFNESNNLALTVTDVNLTNCWGGVYNSLSRGATTLSGVDMAETLGQIDEGAAGLIAFGTTSSVNVTNTTVSGYPFGIYALPGTSGASSVRMVNNTVSGNLMGVVIAATTAELLHNTIINNSSDLSAIESYQLDATGLAIFGSSLTVQLKNNIIAGNFLNGSLSNCTTKLDGISPGSVNVTSSGNLSDDDCAGKMGANDQINVSGVASKIGSLQNNGGSVRTMALLEGSEAIDSADNNVGVETDARGVDRPQLAGFDIGAFEKTAGDPDIQDPDDPNNPTVTPTAPRTGKVIGALMVILSGLTLLGLAAKEVIDLKMLKSKSTK